MNLLGIKDVKSKVSLAQSTIYKMMANEEFPKPVQLTSNRVGWVEAEIDAWLEQRVALRDAAGAQEAVNSH